MIHQSVASADMRAVVVVVALRAEGGWVVLLGETTPGFAVGSETEHSRKHTKCLRGSSFKATTNGSIQAIFKLILSKRVEIYLIVAFALC